MLYPSFINYKLFFKYNNIKLAMLCSPCDLAYVLAKHCCLYPVCDVERHHNTTWRRTLAFGAKASLVSYQNGQYIFGSCLWRVNVSWRDEGLRDYKILKEYFGPPT
jgi:hypothetical protein